MPSIEKTKSARAAFILTTLSWRSNPTALTYAINNDPCDIALYHEVYDFMDCYVDDLIRRIKTDAMYRQTYHITYDEMFDHTMDTMGQLMRFYAFPKQATKQPTFKDNISEFVLRDRFYTACQNNKPLTNALIEEIAEDIYNRFYTLIVKGHIDIEADNNQTIWTLDALTRIAKYYTTTELTYRSLTAVIGELHDYFANNPRAEQTIRYRLDPHGGATVAYMLSYLSEIQSLDDFIIFLYGSFCQRYDNSRLPEKYIRGLHVTTIHNLIYQPYIDTFGTFYNKGTTDPFFDTTMRCQELSRISPDPKETLAAYLDKLLSDMMLTINGSLIPALKNINVLP